MLTRLSLAAGVLGSLLPLGSHAQITSSPRLYVGVGANLLTNVPFKDNWTVPKLVGPALTAGLRLTPRLAVQAGLSYHTQRESFYYAYTSPIGPASSEGSSRANYFIVPVLVRYSPATAAGRLHFDALGGLTLVHATLNGFSHNSGNPLYDAPAYSYADTKASLTLGPALRCTVSPRVEVTANGLVSAALGKEFYPFRDRLFLNVAVGAHYTFG